MINTEVLSTLIPKEEWEPFQEGREAEYIQPLMDLGYLKIKGNNNKQNIGNALFRFRQEYRVLSWLQKEMELLPHLELEMGLEPDSLEIKLLHLLIDMDGDFKIEQLPVDGEQSIISRVIYYRLGVLGLYDGVFDRPYSSIQIDEIFTPLRKWMALEKDHLKLIALAGNVPELIRTAWKKGGLDQRVLCFNYLPKKEILTDDLKDKVKTEPAMSSALAAEEKQILDEVEAEMELMMPKNKASILSVADVKRIEKATSKRTMRHQSRAEKLRNQMSVITEELKIKMEEQKIEQDEFIKKIQEKNLEVKNAEVILGHINLNIVELEAEQQEPKNWKRERRKLEKSKNKLKKDFDISPNDEQNLKILKSNEVKLLERIAANPNNSSARKLSLIHI